MDSASSTEVIRHWYGDIQYSNQLQKEFMFDTATFFELHTSSEVDLKEQILNDIRTRYPPSKL